MPKLPPKLELTAEQKKTIQAIRQHVEQERPELVAEGQRVAQAHEIVSVQLRGAFALLKAVRKSAGVTLAALAGKTGISKGALSRLENDPAPNVTITTIQRVASALGHDLHISVMPRTPAPKEVSNVTIPGKFRRLIKIEAQ